MEERYQNFARQAVSLAKQRAIGVLTGFDDRAAWRSLVQHFDLEDLITMEGCEVEVGEAVEVAIDLSIKLLKLSAQRDTTVIDFDDMIYAPLLHNARVFQNDWVLIDEAQDTNPARRALAKKMLKPGGRLLSVGDPCQAIYGFTGADADSLETIVREFGCKELPLTVTYRCPKSVVAHAQQWVHHIQAADSAPEGEVTMVDEVEFDAYGPDRLSAADAVLCRNTKPLVQLAYRLIRRKIACHVEGRDIGQGLLNLANRWKARTLDALRDKLEQYLEKETEKLMSKGLETKAEALADKVETLFVIMDSAKDKTVNGLRAEIMALFGDTEDGKQSPNLTLSTIHKSKGREWDRVYLLGRNRYMPSKYARQIWQLEQENNLCYVAVTRAKQTLVEVSVA